MEHNNKNSKEIGETGRQKIARFRHGKSFVPQPSLRAVVVCMLSRCIKFGTTLSSQLVAVFDLITEFRSLCYPMGLIRQAVYRLLRMDEGHAAFWSLITAILQRFSTLQSTRNFVCIGVFQPSLVLRLVLRFPFIFLLYFNRQSQQSLLYKENYCVYCYYSFKMFTISLFPTDKAFYAGNTVAIQYVDVLFQTTNLTRRVRLTQPLPRNPSLGINLYFGIM